MVISSALMIWRGIMLTFGTESPMVVVLSGSMEPSMYRSDILVLVRKDTLSVGDVIVYQIASEKIPIVHRITSLQEIDDPDAPPCSSEDRKSGKCEIKKKTIFLTKGDNNPVDDRGLYPRDKPYLDESNVVGHVYA